MFSTMENNLRVGIFLHRTLCPTLRHKCLVNMNSIAKINDLVFDIVMSSRLL